jgi:hypothetical protein
MSKRFRVPKAKILVMPKPAEHGNAKSIHHLPSATILHFPLDAVEESAAAARISGWLELGDTALSSDTEAKVSGQPD